MEIPASPDFFGSKKPTLSVSKIKAYGGAGYELSEGEDIAGCPRLYRQRYIDHNAAAKQESPVLIYGRALHETLDLMERESVSIDDALQQCFPQQLGPKEYQRAREDLEHYLERSEDASLSVLVTEKVLVAPLMDGLDFGGILDRVELDADDLSVVHVRDYKAGFKVPQRADVEGSVQGMAYSWLVWNAWEQIGLPEEPSRVVFHLDSIRWRELVHEYTRTELEDWAEWVRAIARRIWADESAEPVLNPACHYCPVRHDCKAWRRLPGRGPSVPEQMTTQPLDKLIAWQAEARERMKLLDAGVKDVDKILKARIELEGGSVDVEGEVYYMTPWRQETDFDLLGILDDMGRDFLAEVATVSKTDLDKALRRRGQRLHGHHLESFASVSPGKLTVKHRKRDDG